MVDLKVSAMTEVTDLNDDANDFLPVVQNSDITNKKIKVDNFFKGKHTFLIPASAMYRKTTGSVSEVLTIEELATNKINIPKFSFDQTTQEAVQVLWPMPDIYDGGTIEVQFIWKSTLTSGVVRWGCQGRSYGDSETIDQILGTGVEVDDTQTVTANQVLISAYTSAITLGGTPAAGELAFLEIYRAAAHANDTLAGDAALIAIRVRIGVNKKADA